MKKIILFLKFVIFTLLLLTACTLETSSSKIQKTSEVSSLPNTPTVSYTPTKTQSKPPTETSLPRSTNTPGSIAEPSNFPDPSGQNLVFWHLWGYGIQYETIQSIVEEFNTNNDWLINVEAIDIGRYSDIEDAMNDAIRSGDLPNLLVAYSSSLANWLQMDVLVNLNDFIYNQDYGLEDEEIADFFGSAFYGPILEDGTRVGFPLSQSEYVIYYNSTWAKELGFESAPTSTAEFKEQACAAHTANAVDDDPDNDGTGGLVMYTGSSNVISWIFAFGGDIISEDGSGYDFTTPEIEGVATFLKELWDEGCALMTDSYPHPEFATRRALFIMNSSVGIPYQLSAFDDEDAYKDDEWVFIPFVGPEGGQAVNALAQTIGLVNTTPEQNMAAWLFLKYLASPVVQAKWITGSAYYPTKQSVTPLLVDYAAQNPQWDTGLLLLNVGQTEPARASWANVRQEVYNTFSAILQGDPDQIVPLLEELDAIAAEAVAELDQ